MRAVPTATGIIRQGKVFDTVYQLEDKNAAQEEREQTVTSDNLAALMGMVARFGFLATFTPIGSELRARLNDDMADQLMATDEYGLPKNMLSFGLGEIYFPEKELRRFAPFYLASKSAERIIGSSLSEEARNDVFLRFCGRLGLDEQLFALLESIAFRPNDLGGNQPLADYVRTRFRSLLERPLQERLNSMPMVAEELEKELPDQLESTASQVFEEKRQTLFSAASELAIADGLTPLQEVVGALGNFMTERQTQLQGEIEELTMAKNQLLGQKTEVEGDIARIRTLAFGPPKKQSFWDRLAGVDSDMELRVAQLKVEELARTLYQLELDNAIFQLEITRRQEAVKLLSELSEELTSLLEQIQNALARLEELKAQAQPEIDLFFNLDFRFHAPVGFCLIREEPHRKEDIDYFIERLVIDESSSQTVETVILTLREEAGEFWTLAQTEGLEELLRKLIEKRLLNQLHVWSEMKEHLSEEQISDRIRYCVRASAEYLLTDSAVNHLSKSWIKIVGAPKAAHEPLRSLLEKIGHPDFLFVATNDQHRLSFLQVRVGIPLHSIKSHSANREGFSKQSKKHDEERLFTRPEWRFLPDVSPIENPDAPMISIYVLQGVVAGRLVYEQETGTYWYAPFSGPKELMGRDSKEVTDYLLSHQTNFIEIVSSFYVRFAQRLLREPPRFHLWGSSDALGQAVLEVAEEPGPFSDWIDKNTVSAVMKQLEWVRKNYDVGGGL